jgi:Ser/Thr protein kinase RdoA (MazF antagonist)
MSSVFSTRPPSFSEPEITEILAAQFGLSGQSSELYSERDQNFLIQSNSDQKYVLKISNPEERREILDLQNEATLFIHSQDSNFGVPLQIGEILEFEKDGQTYFVRLIEYLEGNFLKDSNMDNAAHKNLGIFLGKLSQSLTGFSHPAADREFEWDVRATELIKSRLDNLKSESGNKTVNHFLNEFEQNISPHELRMAVIHNDGNDHNILVDEQGETTRIIDFGDMVYSYQVTEPAVCMAYVGLENDDPFMPMAHVLKGYHSCFPLTDSELKSALYLSCVRLCISVTMSAWRMNLFPEIKYLSVSQKPAWDLLRKLENEDLKEWSQKLLDFVKY